MTWAFGYFACFIVGLVLAAVTGMIRDLREFARHTSAVPHPNLHLTLLALFARRISPGLVLSGLVGLVLATSRGIDREATLLWACGAGVLGVVAASLLLRRHPSAGTPRGERATVVKAIQPGGYGQVRIERDGVAVLLAAQSVDRLPIPAGSEVEVVELTRSVITVRLPDRP